MDRQVFTEKILKPRLEKINRGLAAKADEYATDGSAFYNFERAARINSTAPKRALWGMATKHLVSIIDMVECGDAYSEEYIDEKIGDMVNYLILLEGILKTEDRL